MLFAATPIPDSAWIPPVLVLIFAVPIGAFLSLYSAASCFLFRSMRENLPIVVLWFLAFSINGCAVILLLGSMYNSNRFLAVPLVGWFVAVASGGVIGGRAAGFLKADEGSRKARMEEALTHMNEEL